MATAVRTKICSAELSVAATGLVIIATHNPIRDNSAKIPDLQPSEQPWQQRRRRPRAATSAFRSVSPSTATGATGGATSLRCRGGSIDASRMDEASGQQTLRRDLYAHVEPYDSGFLKVSDLHTIFYEQFGKPQRHPVVFLHWGPGAGASIVNRKFFDPEFYRIVLFDKRGSSKSTPHACLEENTTWDLVADIEKLREHLDIPEWCLEVHGGAHCPLLTAKRTLIRLLALF